MLLKNKILKKIKLEYILLPLIIFFTLFPRGVEVLNGNYLFGFDQGREYLMTKKIAYDHKVTLIGTELGAGSAGVSGIFHGPGYYYFLAIPFVLFKGDPYGGVLMMFFFSVATVIFSFFLGRKLFGSLFGMITALFVSVSPPLISQARFLWSPNLTSFFILLAIYFAYRISEKRNLFIFLAAFFSAFTYNFEFAIAVPLCIGLFLYALYSFRLSNIKKYVFLFIGFFLGFLPMLLFEVRHGFIAFNGFISYLSSPKSDNQAAIGILNIIQDRLGYFYFVLIDTFPKSQIAAIIATALFIVGVYFMFREKNKALKNFLIYLLTLVFVSLFVFSLLKTPVYHYYLTHLNFVFIIFAVYSLYSANMKKNLKALAVLVVLLLVLIFPAFHSSLKTSIRDYYDYGGVAKNKGLTDAIDFIYSDAGGRPFNLLIFAPPVYTYQYDYMLRWYAQNKYSYLPGGEKKGLTYLWIEVDPYKPWSYEGWLETVIGEGKILKETKLPSGFIVQKRNF